jgi:uncharacterized protein YukE
MANPDILLDLDMLRDEVIPLNKQKLDEIDQSMEFACTVVATLTTIGWTGMASETYRKSFTEFKQQMRLFHLNLSMFNEQLTAINSSGDDVFARGSTLFTL